MIRDRNAPREMDLIEMSTKAFLFLFPVSNTPYPRSDANIKCRITTLWRLAFDNSYPCKTPEVMALSLSKTMKETSQGKLTVIFPESHKHLL